MKIKAVKCKGCGDIIYSCARHDFRWCSCKKTACDGGQTDYVKVSFNDKIGFENVDLDLDVTIKQLFDDWNNGNSERRKFGLIKL